MPPRSPPANGGGGDATVDVETPDVGVETGREPSR